jgi:hypothetical protein
MAIEVFNRYETKFIIDIKKYNALMELLEDRITPDEYNKDGKAYTICNVYYDTWDDNLIRTSLEKPKYKEKLRLRSYGTVKSDAVVFLEIKKKFNGIVNKRRTKISLEDADALVNNHIFPEIKDYMNEQVLNEIYYFVKNYDVMPKTYIAYDRKAYTGKEDKSLRITFDRNIRSRRYAVALDKGDYGRQIISGNLRLMEIKCSGAMPLWLTKILSDLEIYKTSFSKYGTEYKQYLEQMEELNYA